MTKGPLERAISRRRELLAENSELRAKTERNTAEIAQIDAALTIMKKYAPPEGLPGLDEDVTAGYGDLASMTVPDGLAMILYKRGEPMTSRELLDILVKAGKLKANTNNSMIHVIGSLKRNERRFRKVGAGWTLIEPNHQLRVLEGIENVGAEG
jgi:hypothetical protein